MSGWRPALRIARRTVRRNLGRSLLVAILVGLPVAGATFVDVLVRTFGDVERSTTRDIGSADAELTITGSSRIEDYTPFPYGGGYESGGRDRRPAKDVDLAAELPAGSTWIQRPRTYETRLSLDGDRIVRPMLVVADPGSALADHVRRLEQGALPTTDDGVVVTESLAERLDLLDGEDDLIDDATLTVADGPTSDVTGIFEAPFCLDCEQVLAAPGSSVADTAVRSGDYSGVPANSYLVDLPAGTDIDGLWPQLAEHGIALTPRDAYLDPDKYDQYAGDGISPLGAADLRAAALVLLVTGLGLLEVILLAGTAFAVGARRQVREFGVVSASGATSRQIRRIVLAQGLVLGVVGSVLGIVFGAAAALAGQSWWEKLDNGIVSTWRFGPWEILVAAAVGAVSGVLAAVVPAIGAGRMTTVDALSGRFRVSATSKRRTPVAGGVLVAVGVVTGLVGDRMMAADFAAYVRQLARVDETGSFVSPPSPTVPVGLVLLGAVLAVVGMVVLAPALITGVGRLAGRLPLSGRLAFRDASRHRHRTGPATSAIAVAVAGSVVFAFVLAGQTKADELSYVAYLPPDVMSVSGRGDVADKFLVETARDAADRLPLGVVVTPAQVTREESSGRRGATELYAVPADCANGCTTSTLAVADPDVMALALGREPTDDELAQIADGKALVVSSALVDDDGRVSVETGFGKRGPITVSLPGAVADVARPYPSLPGVFVSRELVESQGWGTFAPVSLVTFDGGSATPDQVDDAKTVVEEQGAYPSLDTGPADPSRIALVIAGVAAAFVTLVGVAISVALSAAEGRADLATLAAVGAPPRRRRSLAAAQALLVGGLGCIVGLLLGVFVSYTLRSTIGAPSFVVPWINLLAVGIVVPLLAVAVAGGLTPSRLPLVRRDRG